MKRNKFMFVCLIKSYTLSLMLPVHSPCLHGGIVRAGEKLMNTEHVRTVRPYTWDCFTVFK